VKWADEAGVFRIMADLDGVTCDDVVAATPLNRRGAHALLGVLCGLEIVDRSSDGRYALTEVAREYLDSRRPFYIGPALFARLTASLPQAFSKGYRPPRLSDVMRDRLESASPGRDPYTFGHREQLSVQHTAGFAPAAVAVRTGVFDGTRHLIDLCGGSGVFSIPLALRHPAMRITLVDLPYALPVIEEYLQQHAVADRIHLTGFNVFQSPWPVPRVDGVLIANFLHGCDDDECRLLLREIRKVLLPRGRVFIHEMLWNDEQTGPLLTALWNFLLASGSSGGQRTAAACAALLSDAGFGDVSVVPTAGCYSLISATKHD